MGLNKKGFTLIEVIIALAIMTTVIFLGYTVINKVQVVSKDQSQISDVQNGFNNFKRYISNELKLSEDVQLRYDDELISVGDVNEKNYGYITDNIESVSTDKNFSYDYVIKTDNKTVYYNVSIYKKGNKKLYSIDRVDDKVQMNLIINQPLSDGLMPLKIVRKDNLYDVELNYIKQNTKIYSFDVYSRKSSFGESDNNNPVEPEESIVGDGYFGYCISQSIKLLTESGFEDLRVNDIVTSLKETLKKDINSNQDSIKRVLKSLQYDLIDIIKNSSDIPESSYDNLNKSLYYMDTGEETLDELDEPNNDNKAKEIAINIHNGIYDDENGYNDVFVHYLNNFTDSIKHHGNGVNVEYATKLSSEVKSNFDDLWKYINKTAGSNIFDIIHASWMGISKEDKESICKTMNTVIDNVIESKVYIDKVVREDILKEGNVYDVTIKAQKVNDELEDLIDALIEIKACVYSSNFYTN